MDKVELSYACIEHRVPRRLRREPEVMVPGFEFIVGKDIPDGFRGNGLDDTLSFQLPRQFATVPLRERGAAELRPLAGKPCQVHRHRVGKMLAVVPGRICRTDL
jgi:hypothetical protein